jgi:hypothetical protein
MAKGLRRVVLGGVTYLFKVEHAHEHAGACAPGEGCRERFTAYREGCRACPLRITFHTGGAWQAGYPAAGVVWKTESPEITANLNTPSVARRLIEAALSLGWSPTSSRVPHVIDDGYPLLDARRLG